MTEAHAVAHHQVPASPTERAVTSAASLCCTRVFGRYGRAVPVTVVEAAEQSSISMGKSEAVVQALDSQRAHLRSTASTSSNRAHRPPLVEAEHARTPVPVHPSTRRALVPRALDPREVHLGPACKAWDRLRHALLHCPLAGSAVTMSTSELAEDRMALDADPVL